jgi:hypothetical protein
MENTALHCKFVLNAIMNDPPLVKEEIDFGGQPSNAPVGMQLSQGMEVMA